MDLMQFTANQLKWLITNQAPEIKGYKKKPKPVLVRIINDNNINTETLEALIIVTPPPIDRTPSFTVRFD
jgi:hypothetical protein